MTALHLGIYAVPFGYGPISKAVSIARAIRELANVEIEFLCHGSSLEYVLREQIPCEITVLQSIDVDESVAQRVVSKLDGVIVVMHRPWANRLAPHVPVYFVDSLGFMWNQNSFQSFPGFAHLKRFYVQDLFGALENLKATGLSSLWPVPPIFATTVNEACELGTGRAVFQLGGLSNPFAEKHTVSCANMLMSLADEFAYSHPLFLTSDEVIEKAGNSFAPREVRAVCHADALACYRNARVLFTAPGLTTLLELAHFEISVCPIPPENFSQCLNVHNLVQAFHRELPTVWHFLSDEYSSLKKGMNEREGVVELIDLNRRKLNDVRFRREYVRLANDALTENRRLPAGLRRSRNGAEIISQDILALR